MRCGKWTAIGNYDGVDVGMTCPGDGTVYPGMWWTDDVDYIDLD